MSTKYRFYKLNSTIPTPTNGKQFLTLPTRIIYTTSFPHPIEKKLSPPPLPPGGKFKWNRPKDKQCCNFLLLQKVFI